MPEHKDTNTASHLPVDTRMWPLKRYIDMHRRSLDNPERFWSEEARKLDWYETWDKVLDGEHIPCPRSPDYIDLDQNDSNLRMQIMLSQP